MNARRVTTPAAQQCPHFLHAAALMPRQRVSSAPRVAVSMLQGVVGRRDLLAGLLDHQEREEPCRDSM